MKVECGPVACRVLECTKDEWAKLWAALANPEGECLIRPDGAFASGLVGHVGRSGIELEGLPKPDESWRNRAIDPELLEGITLRDYQIKAIRKSMIHRRGIIAQATGSGKSEILAAIIKLIGGKSITITDTISAAEQLAERLKTRGIESVGMLGGGRKRLSDHNLVVSNSAYSRVRRRTKNFLKLLGEVRLLAFDEVHHLATSQTWLAVANACSAPYRIGLSATPFAAQFSVSDLKLVGALGDVIDRLPSKELRDDGYLAEPIVFLLDVGGSRVSPRIDDWLLIENLGVVEHEYRNNLIVSTCAAVLAVELDARILVLVRRINHGRFLNTTLNGMGISSRFSCGGKKFYGASGSAGYRRYEDVKNDFDAGEFSVLIGSTVFNESADMPATSDIILAAAGRHPRPLLQRLGRGMRRAPGKEIVRIWDFFDRQHWATKAQSNARVKVYGAEEIEVISKAGLVEQILARQLDPKELRGKL